MNKGLKITIGFFVFLILIPPGVYVIRTIKENREKQPDGYYSEYKEGEVYEGISDRSEPVEVEHKQIQYEKATFVSDGINSYWFIVVQNKENNSMINAIMKQEHSYFSTTEAREHFGKKEDYFLMNFIEVSEATYLQ